MFMSLASKYRKYITIMYVRRVERKDKEKTTHEETLILT